MTERTYEELVDLSGFLTARAPTRIKAVHVHECVDSQGLKLSGTYVRLTMTNAHGHAATMLFADELWPAFCDIMIAVGALPTEPDTGGCGND